MKPVLSIGIIFKNEIRCLERCVKSLQPLRDAVPCELVMADTGSDDGSREVAEKYADICFDFPWINDFAAARNAVVDRCSGEWYLSIDADEWLDEDIFQLVRFLTHRERWERPLCGVMLRNYYTPELDRNSNDFLAIRMALLSTGARFTGAIHELWDLSSPVCALEHTLLHHDGYVNLTGDWSKKKHERNMALLEKELEKNPKNLRTLLQCIESSQGDPGYEGYIRRAVAALKEAPPDGMYYGAPILRYAVLHAAGCQLPELEEWTNWAVEEFSESPYVNIDIAYVRFVGFAEKQDYTRAILCGETYLKTLEDYHTQKIDFSALVFGSFVMATQSREDGVRAILADAYFHEGQPEKARDMLLSIDRAGMRPEIVKNYMSVLMNLHTQSGVDLSWIMTDLWEKTGQSKKREALRTELLRASAIAFSEEHRRGETESGFTHAYTMFLPLAGRCGLGAAAAILESSDQIEMEQLLKTVDDWEELPIVALERALLTGVEFPDRLLTLEEMDTLASRLAQSGEHLPEILDGAVRSMGNGPQALFWARGLVLAAVSTNKWEDGAEGFHLAKTFADVEKVVLPQYYAADMLQSERIGFLPPLHRFGWYCVQAFDALETGKKADYVRLLREGLTSCPGMKPMVECLLARLEDERQVQALPELLRLADQIRTLLARYPANDPAVVVLKQSEAYQKVAHLIEEPELDIFGGLPS